MIELECDVSIPNIAINGVRIWRENELYVLVELNHPSHIDNYTYLIIDRKKTEFKYIYGFKQLYKFDIFKNILIVNKIYEDDYIRTSQHFDKSYVVGINIGTLFNNQNIFTSDDLDFWILEEKNKLEFSLISQDWKSDYRIDNYLIGSMLYIEQYSCYTKNFSKKAFWYDIESGNKIFVTNDNNAYVKLVEIDNKLATNKEDTKLVNWNYDLIHECEKGYVIERIIFDKKDNYYLICENEKFIKVLAIDKTDYTSKVIFKDVIWEKQEDYWFEILDYEIEKWLLIYRRYDAEYKYEYIKIEASK